MSKRNLEAILEKCEALTQNGETLSVEWDGGGDEGQFNLKLDERVLEDDYGKEDSILDLVEDELDYGNFSGPFSTIGEVVYDKDEKCFKGTDTYSETDTAIAHCKIKIQLPETIWFDRVELEFEWDWDDPVSSANLIILNGPLTDVHNKMENKIADEFSAQIKERISELNSFDSINEQISISRSDFAKMDNNLVYTIEEFNYWYDNVTCKDIHISLTE